MAGGNNTTNLLSDTDNAKLQDFLQQFGLQDQVGEIIQAFQKLGAGALSRQDFLKLLAGNGTVTEKNVSKVFQNICAEVIKIMKQAAEIKPPVELTIESPTSLDVPAQYIFEDKVFHEFLDYLKSIKVSHDVERKIFNIFISLLKGLRDDLEARDVLGKKEIEGGCNMSGVQVDEVFSNLQKAIKEMQEYGFTNESVINWFRNHYDTLMTKRLEVEKIKDLQIDSHKEEAAGEHRMEVPRASREKTIEELLINPNHDFNMPLDKHIRFHFDAIKSEPELPAAVKPLEISTPAPAKNIPVKTTPDKIMRSAPAPLPTREPVKQLEIKSSDGISPVAKEVAVPTLTSPSPVMDRVTNIPGRDISGTSDGILPKRVMPTQLKEMAEQNMAPEGTDLIKETIAKRAKKPGFFSRVFNRKKALPAIKPTSVSPMMKSETINAIPMNQGRPQMTDVTFTPKLVTPVDELQSLTLQDFRRLSKDPLTAIRKISDKLDLLSQESLRKKAEGIEALKKSALYRDYSAIMSESVMKSVSYNQVIQEKKTLTEAEYQALMQLNKLLRS